MIRLRYEPTRVPARAWLRLAAVLWVFVKLPQEYWIHVAKLDFTDTVADHPWFGFACAVAILSALATAWLIVRPRLPPPSHDWRLRAGPLPRQVRRRRRAGLAELAEQVALLALLCIVYAEILPGIDATPPQVIIGIVLIVAGTTSAGAGGSHPAPRC